VDRTSSQASRLMGNQSSVTIRNLVVHGWTLNVNTVMNRFTGLVLFLVLVLGFVFLVEICPFSTNIGGGLSKFEGGATESKGEFLI